MMSLISYIFRRSNLILILLSCIFSIVLKPRQIKFSEKNYFFLKEIGNGEIVNGNFFNTTWKRMKLLGYIQEPTFLYGDNIYDQNFCLITQKNSFEEKNLIVIDDIKWPLFKKSYEELKKIPNIQILEISLIDGRRWNVKLLHKGKKVIKIIFNPGIPDINKLKKWNEIYDLFDKMTTIDLRFNKFMLV